MKVTLLKKLVKILLKEMVDPSTEPEGWSQPSSQSLYSTNYLNQLIELAKLNQSQKAILQLRLDGFSETEVAEKLGVSRTRIHHIEKKAISKLRIAASKDIHGPPISLNKSKV